MQKVNGIGVRSGIGLTGTLQNRLQHGLYTTGKIKMNLFGWVLKLVSLQLSQGMPFYVV